MSKSHKNPAMSPDSARAGRDSIARPKGQEGSTNNGGDGPRCMSEAVDSLESQVRKPYTVGGEKFGHCR